MNKLNLAFAVQDKIKKTSSEQMKLFQLNFLQ